MSDEQSSETPRTDAIVGRDDWEYSKNMGEHARQLERELNAAKAESDLLRSQCEQIRFDFLEAMQRIADMGAIPDPRQMQARKNAALFRRLNSEDKP